MSAQKSVSKPSRSKVSLFSRVGYLFIFVILASLTFSVQAQNNVRFKSSVSRITVPPGFSGTVTFTNLVTTNGTGVAAPVDLFFTNLPSGVTYSIGSSIGGSLPAGDGGLPSTLCNTGMVTTLTFSGATSKGTYALWLCGTNNTGTAKGYWPFVLQVAPTWASSSNNINSSAGLWSASSSWANGSSGMPGTSDDVVFDNTTATPVAINTNSVVDANTTIGSLRFSQTNGSSSFSHNLYINPNVTLNITGVNGFSLLRDYVPVAAKMNVTIYGTNATMSVVNESANFAVQAEGNNFFTLDMSKLDNLNLDVNRIPLGDYQAYPNLNYYNNTNNYGDVIKQFAPFVSLGRTNIIKAVYTDVNNYTNGSTRNYALTLANNYAGGTGSSPAPTLNFGQTNFLAMDSICFVHCGGKGVAQFSSIYNGLNPIVVFRNSDGVSRMSIMTLADQDGSFTVGSGSGEQSTVNFLAGTIDAKVDRFYMSMDRTNTLTGVGINSFFSMGSGNFDCNSAILGYNQYSIHTNNSACEATLSISNGTFHVNKDMILGYTTDPSGTIFAVNHFGKVAVYNGGTLCVSNLLVGGVTKISVGNAISLTNATLIVTNKVGSDKALDNMNIVGSTLVLNLDGSSGTPVINAANFSTSGANAISINSITHIPTSLLIPVVAWTGTAPGSFTLITTNANNGAGFNGGLVTDPSNPNQLDVQVLTTTPKKIWWTGASSAVWDNSTANWKTTNGTATTFAPGDNVIFDDSSSVASITLDSSSTILVGSITMTNATKSYVFNSGGAAITGSSALNKYGTNNLELDATASSLTVNVNAGSLTGSGAVNAISVASGAQMNYTGNANGSISCAGVGTSSGTVTGSLTVQANGVYTNAGTINGSPLGIGSGATLVNELSGNMTSIGSTTVSTNAYLYNRGLLKGVGITVNNGGTFKDSGETDKSITLGDALTIAGGGTFIPGGDGIGTTTVYYISTSGSAPHGRVAFQANSTNIFKVDAASGNCTHLNSQCFAYGPSQTFKSVNGGILQIVNTNTTTGYSVYTYHFFGDADNYSGNPSTMNIGTATLNTTNSYPTMSPAAPASGLAWDVSQVYYTGNIGITTVSIVPTNVVYIPTITTLSTTNSTNSVIISQLQWPTDHTGWRLQSQSTSLSVGITTNWTDVYGAVWTNQILLTNNIVTNNAVFYRMIYP